MLETDPIKNEMTLQKKLSLHKSKPGMANKIQLRRLEASTQLLDNLTATLVNNEESFRDKGMVPTLFNQQPSGVPHSTLLHLGSVPLYTVNVQAGSFSPKQWSHFSKLAAISTRRSHTLHSGSVNREQLDLLQEVNESVFALDNFTEHRSLTQIGVIIPFSKSALLLHN